MRKFKVNCIAITNKNGVLFTDEKITRGDRGQVVKVEPVILDEEEFHEDQLASYLKGGHLVPYGDQLEDLKQEYLQLSGNESVPKNWGEKKLKAAIQDLKDG